MRRVFVFVFALILASSAPLLAQGEQSGAIRGRLSSSDGLALPGAVVTVVSPSLRAIGPPCPTSTASTASRACRPVTTPCA